jgi:5'-AMP-activated protein kinase catalytic alpha subunit
MEKYDFESDHTVRCLEANKHNHVTTTYYLLLKKHLREGGTSIADFDNYLPENFDKSRRRSSYQTNA